MDLREIDKLVAEKVMGYQVIETMDCGGVDNYWLSKDGQNVFDDMDLPEYSTSIADAWDVIERFKNWHLTYCNTSCDYTCSLFICPEVCAETAPLAICLAALNAKGIEVKD